MIMSLPATGAVIISSSVDAARAISNQVLELRGPAVDAVTEVVAVERFADLDRLRNIDRPILVDHAFWPITAKSLQRETERTRDEVNSRFSRGSSAR